MLFYLSIRPTVILLHFLSGINQIDLSSDLLFFDPLHKMTRRIRVSGNQLCVLVLDQEGYELAQARGDDLLALVKSHEMKGCKSPRLCHVTRNHSHSGLGLSFNPVEGTVVQDLPMYFGFK